MDGRSLKAVVISYIYDSDKVESVMLKNPMVSLEHDTQYYEGRGFQRRVFMGTTSIRLWGTLHVPNKNENSE